MTYSRGGRDEEWGFLDTGPLPAHCKTGTVEVDFNPVCMPDWITIYYSNDQTSGVSSGDDVLSGPYWYGCPPRRFRPLWFVPPFSCPEGPGNHSGSGNMLTASLDGTKRYVKIVVNYGGQQYGGTLWGYNAKLTSGSGQ